MNGRLFFILLSFISICGCTKNKAEIGSSKNPIKFFLVPSVDTKLLEEAGQKIKTYLEDHTPYKYKIAVPTSYIAVVEAFGTNRADVASLNTFGYILANERYGVEARITFIRFGSESYQSQIIARSDSSIKNIKDLNDKKFAYVDPASTSGYLMPAKLFSDNKVLLKQTVFAQKHDNVVTMVYQGRVDAGATYYSPSENGEIQDARRMVKTQFPDVEKKIKIIALTDPIPNDPIVFRKDLSEEIKDKVISALIEMQKTEEGKKIFYDIYSITGMNRSTDKHYDSVRDMLLKLGRKASDYSK
ncbi:MAG: phosphonates-binding protein [Bdellovibrionales bacterium RBG_16_40_8]|nr:MAG: phosphonates-binding protein [Bdellovibrionales bacterium RBG_16_40_8]